MYWLTTPVLQYVSIGRWRLFAIAVAAACGGALSLQMSDEEKTELRQQLEKDCVLRKLLELRVQLTQRNYLLFAYWDDRTLHDLGPEERAELPEGFEDWPEDELKVN